MEKTLTIDVDNLEEKSPISTPSSKKGRPRKIKGESEEEMKEYLRAYHRQRYEAKKDELKANCNKNSRKYRESYKIILQIAEEKELNFDIWNKIKDVLEMKEENEEEVEV